MSEHSSRRNLEALLAVYRLVYNPGWLGSDGGCGKSLVQRILRTMGFRRTASFAPLNKAVACR